MKNRRRKKFNPYLKMIFYEIFARTYFRELPNSKYFAWTYFREF